MFLFLASLARAEDPPSADEIDAFLGETETKPPLPPVSSPNAFNPRITAFGDALLSVAGHGAEVDPASAPWLRSLELDLRADVDPYAKAVAVIALHQEAPVGGHAEGAEEHGAEEVLVEDTHSAFSVAPEEVYVDFVNLPAGLGVRAGQFKLPFGITNKMHPHDYPWPDAPEPFAEMLGEEGLADMGAYGSWRPANPLGVGVTLQGGAVAGEYWDPDAQTPLPAWFGRAELFYDFGRVDVGLGASSFGLATDHLDGADLLVRYTPSGWRSIVAMGELFRSADEMGFTSTLQLQPARRLYIGGRLDGELGDDTHLFYGGAVSFYTSEFLRLRAGCTSDGDEWLANGQLTFVWGSHPVEPYWVNR